MGPGWEHRGRLWSLTGDSGAFILLKSDCMCDPGVRLLPGANCTHFPVF